MDRALTPASGASWVPAQIRWTAAGPVVDWCHLGDLRFVAPFFEQTVNDAMAHPFNRLFAHSTPLAAIGEPDRGELRLSGLIFHMSRCGSTLMSQMLAALPRNVVLSEPTPIDQVLRTPSRLPGLSDDQIAVLLRGMTAALGRRRTAQERDLFVKLEGWHILLLPLIRRAFPDVPWVFLYRDPLEVLASLSQLRPRPMLPGGIDATLLGVDAATALAMSPDAYSALVLRRVCEAAIAHAADGGGLLIEYRELPGAACAALLDHFGLRYDAEELACMRETARFDAKAPRRLHVDDSEAKRHGAGEEIRNLAAGLAPLYARLDALRLQPTARDQGSGASSAANSGPSMSA
jgi:hypothetical protein